MLRSTLIAICLVLFGAAPLAAPQDFTLPRTESGPVRGHAVRGVVAFSGIPFAAPPVGALRGRAPQPVTAWTNERDATAFDHECMQVKGKPDAIFTTSAEDCLYLNVWRPFDARPGANLPVLFWIHGGFVNGGTSASKYDGTAFARQGIVFVSANYRLARPGMFTHPALLAANDGVVDHFGYVDQVDALQWVQRNIEAFGGDAQRVTIIGESLGGASVIRHLTSTSSFGLFHQAVIMSGGSYRSPLTRPLQDVFRSGRVADVQVIIGADMSRDEPARMVARKLTAQGQRAWLYRVTHLPDDSQLQSRGDDAGELPFVFRTLDSLAANGEGLALAFNTYVSNFVKEGDPNGGGLPGWPSFESSTVNLMHFALEGPRYQRDPRDVELVERAAGAWVANAWH